MGVPGFFLWLMKKYKNDGFVFQKEKLDPKNNYEQFNDVNSIDYFLIDANCLVHPVCFKTLADNPDLLSIEKLEHKMLNNICEYLEKIIKYTNPKKGVYIAIDGIAPAAKIKQQRSRRFKSIADKNLWDKIKIKHNKPLGNYWNNNAVTPGTIFMEKLHQKLLVWAKTLDIPIIYSSCFTPAEGEHKLLQFIRTNQKNKKEHSYVIYGLDADLIFLALSTESDKIYLLREANELNNKESKEILNYISIKIMRQSIVNTITKYILNTSEKLEINEIKIYGFDNLDSIRIVNDFIFMCYFLGNDFLPHIPSLDIHQTGIESLIISWVQTLIEIVLENNQIEYLLNDKKSLCGKTLSKINNNFLSKFIKKLSLEEETILRENFANKGKRWFCHKSDPYDKEISRIENLQFKINDPILLGSDNPNDWRFRYYNHYWGVDKEELEEFSQKLVIHYLTGIKWVTQYYFDKCPSWEWYYPFDHPPFISDITKYLNKFNINKVKFELGEPLKPYMQLLSVLPPQSSYLLPDSISKLMTNPKSSLIYLYPKEFDQDFINKKKYWMAIPKLPPLDIKLIKHSYFKYKNELSDDEQKINESKKVFEINFI